MFPIRQENCHKHTHIHTCQCCKTGSFTRKPFSLDCQKEKPNFVDLYYDGYNDYDDYRLVVILFSFFFEVLHKRQIVCAAVIKILVYTAQISRANVCVCVYDIYISYFVRIHVNCIKNNHNLPEQMPPNETCVNWANMSEREREREQYIERGREG